MGRNLTTLFLFAFLSGLALAGDPPAEHPKTGEPLVVECLRGTPTIDGDLKDWFLSHMTPAVVDTEEQLYSGQGAWNGPDDCSGKFYVMWDDSYLYVASVITDDKIVDEKTGTDIWRTDCVELFLSTTNAVAGHAEHYQYGFTPLGKKWNWCNMDGNSQRDPDYVELASSITDTGYICEAALNYKEIKSLKWEVGNAIGLHPVMDDSDVPGQERKLQITWTGREAHDQSLGFGHMILSNQSAPVDSKGKLVLRWADIKAR